MTGFDAELRAIWEESRSAMLERVDAVEAAVAAGAEGTLDAATRAQAVRHAHMLAGSAGTFGFAHASVLARQLETELAGDGMLGPELRAVAGRLRAELEGEPGAEPPKAAGSQRAAGPRPGLLLTGDPDLCSALAREAGARGVVAECAPTLADARRAIGSGGADLLVLDLGAPEGVGEALDTLVAVGQQLPVAVLTDPALLVDRVEVARRGGRAFLPRAASVVAIADTVLALRERVRPRGATVLAVDDDPTILDALRAVLGDAGLRVEGLEDPALFLETLEAVAPDLVLLDIDMPGISGLELCRALRAEPRWEGLPVMVITARADPDTVVEVFGTGADDFVAKPIIPAELLARVNGRLERVRLFRALAETDPLTGLANRRRSHEALSDALATAERLGEPLSLATIDLDGFKTLNDSLGHAAGDAALRVVAGALNRTFTGGESVARWGGDEFVVGMPGLTSADARERVASFLEELRQARSDGVTSGLRATAGVAQYPRDARDLHTLHAAADAALYLAKAAGGDRVHDAGAELHVDPETVDVLLVADDDAQAALVVDALRRRGYSTRRVAGPDAAAALAAPAASMAPVVLLDWDLPGVDGLPIVRALAAGGALDRSTVIMVTGHASEADVDAALAAGVASRVGKPIPLDVLLGHIRAALARPGPPVYP